MKGASLLSYASRHQSGICVTGILSPFLTHGPCSVLYMCSLVLMIRLRCILYLVNCLSDLLCYTL